MTNGTRLVGLSKEMLPSPFFLLGDRDRESMSEASTTIIGSEMTLFSILWALWRCHSADFNLLDHCWLFLATFFMVSSVFSHISV